MEKLSCSYKCFDEKQQPLTDMACGTTNVDYSDNLYLEFQKFCDYRKTALEVDPTGFNVATENEDLYREPKIDLPDSWVRGFLQVSSAMALPSQKFVCIHRIFIFSVKFFEQEMTDRKNLVLSVLDIPQSARSCCI